jgi:hypothetical protein
MSLFDKVSSEYSIRLRDMQLKTGATFKINIGEAVPVIEWAKQSDLNIRITTEFPLLRVEVL